MAELSPGAASAASAALAAKLRVAGHGITSICSAHPLVLRSAFEQALEDGSSVLVESTSNQVNQAGGYTGFSPAQFVALVRGLAAEEGLPEERLVLGGDHLGPHPWKAAGSVVAMGHAAEMMRQYASAGYAKLHLDASMACADDAGGEGEDALAAARTADLAAAAEEACAGRPASSPLPLYVIGTEVPAPGGQAARAEAGPSVTRVADAERALELTRRAFERRGVGDAWQRVIALVVQCGVEFGDDVVFRYQREPAAALAAFARRRGGIVYEAHSTDYQDEAALRAMVEDGFAILKVGPALTFAFREAVFALEAIEREILGRRAPERLSGLRQVLDQAMCRDPRHWRPYLPGDDEHELRLRRQYGLSDRVRYYWPVPDVQEALRRLFANLEGLALPRGLLSQYLPDAVDAFAGERAAGLAPRLARQHVRGVLRRYARAGSPGPGLAARAVLPIP